jgi:catechol 2,3-dioxygenase-like lactoylglutathione lyase family enzyme
MAEKLSDVKPSDVELGRVIGLGGVFFKSSNGDGLNSWYADNLGMSAGEGGYQFMWRDHDHPEIERQTVWSVFPDHSTYFDPSRAPFMLNYIVDDLDAILAKLSSNGVRIDPKREDHDYGRFAWIYDPDGNKIELWEPRGA